MFNQEQIEKLRGSIKIEYTMAKLMAEKLRKMLDDHHNNKTAVRTLGSLTGNQAIQLALAGVEAIYLSGWQTAVDNNLAGQMYPDQSLYPVNSVPSVVKSLNNALQRSDQIQSVNGSGDVDYFLPIVADAEAGFGGTLNAYELMKAMIEAGAAGVHFEDQLSSAKKCGHLGGKVLVPGSEFIKKLKAARLAAEVADTDTVIIARTDANSAKLLTSDVDKADQQFLTSKERTPEGFYQITGGLDMAIARGLQYAPYADLLWCETSKPDLEEARKFAEAIHAKFPQKMLAYNCSPSFNWKANRDKTGPIEDFQNELAKMGYTFQFVTLAGFHNLNLNMFKLALRYKHRGMEAYSEMQEQEFEYTQLGFTAVKHQQFVGTSYFDEIQKTVGDNSTVAMDESTEAEQF